MTAQKRRKAARPAPPRVKRDLVYRHYSQEELDRQYNQATLAPDLSEYSAHWMAQVEAARKSLPCALDVPYGRSDIEKLDIYGIAPDARRKRPVLMFLRGGAWQRLSKEFGAFAAEAVCRRGAILVTPDHTLAKVDAPAGQPKRMVDQVRRAFAWTWKNISDYGGDPDRLYVGGHSSGAHLAASVLADGWRKKAGLPEDAIKGGIVFSGAYDLEPVRLSARNDYMKLTKATAEKLSANRHVPRGGPPVFVAVAEGDLHEFRRQGRAFAAAWGRRGNPVAFADVADANHFDMADLLSDPKTPHGRALVRMLDGKEFT